MDFVIERIQVDRRKNIFFIEIGGNEEIMGLQVFKYQGFFLF